MNITSTLSNYIPKNMKLYAATAAAFGVISLSAACGAGEITISPTTVPQPTRVSVESVESTAPDINATVEARVQATVAAMSPVAQTPTPSPDYEQGRIVFRSDRSGNFETYVMKADGSGLERLTNHTASDTNPVWIPIE